MALEQQPTKRGRDGKVVGGLVAVTWMVQVAWAHYMGGAPWPTQLPYEVAVALGGALLSWYRDNIRGD